jgi:hypothetical protein
MPIPNKGVRWASPRLVDKVVTWFDEDGAQHSRSCEDPELFEWLRKGGKPDDPLPLPPPVSVARWQIFAQLAEDGIVSKEEALAAVKSGEIPETFTEAIAKLPAKSRFTAEIYLAGSPVLERHHPITAALAKALGWDDDALDTLWHKAVRKT